MIKTLLSLVLIINLYGSSLSEKIEKNQNLSSKKSSQSKQISSKIDSLANKIKKQNKEVKNLDSKISKLSNKIEKQNKSIKSNKTTKEKLIQKSKELTSQKSDIEKQIIPLISGSIGYDIIFGKDISYMDKSAVILDVSVKTLNKNLDKKLQKLHSKYKTSLKDINDTKNKISKLNKELDNYLNKKKKLKRLKAKQIKQTKALKATEKKYKQRLKKIKEEQQSIRNLLKALRSKQDMKAYNTSKKIDQTKVKLLGSSYTKPKLKRYRGKKTISPIKNPILKRKFGTYKDPIYGIKIFNHSIILHSNHQNAKVRNMLDGKIVFANKTKLLKNIIIVESKNNINIIYANLSDIAPIVKIGSKIKKGYVIGRIEDDLNLEITQKNFHINPIRMIEGM